MQLKTLLAAVCLLLAPLFSNCSSLNPPVLPLIVRNPYLSTWLGNARDEPWSKWPMFWTGEEIGFGILASVKDSGYVYPLLGRPHDSLLPVHEQSGYDVAYPTYLGAKYDASTTNLSYSIPGPHNGSKPAEIVISFLSPITPTSTFRQSLPAAYITVSVEGAFDIDIYFDINGQWASGDRGSQLTWDFSHVGFGEDPGLKTWSFQRKVEALFTEYRDRAEWGTVLFSAPADVRHESGTSAVLRSRFSRTGTLQNAVDDNYRGIMEDEPVFAFAKSFKLGPDSNSSSSTTSSVRTESVTLTIAHVQEYCVQFAAARGPTIMRPLWASEFASAHDLLKFHYLDFGTVSRLAKKYSNQLQIDAYASGADDYRDIVALSARQVIGSTVFVGTLDDPILFLKEISSNGNMQTVDVVFPAFPFFLYSNPKWLGYLLEPILEHTLSGQYPNKYAMHDIGTHFPNATGHPDGRDEYMPVEECGNILIMGLALVNTFKHQNKNAADIFSYDTESVRYKQSPPSEKIGVFPLRFKVGEDRYLDANDHPVKANNYAKNWVEKSYKVWKQWTWYLVEYSLTPANQLSTDDFAGWLALQTNLALKGIIGVRAMSKLAEIVGNDDDAKKFHDISQDFVEKWEKYGMSRDNTHAKLAYDWYGSWTTLYNLYADSLLCFRVKDYNTKDVESSHVGGQKPIKDPKHSDAEFVPKHIYKKQSDWYYYVRQKFGLPLDSRHLYTKSDWEFFAMAVSSRRTREPILESVANWVNETVTDRPMTDLYLTEGNGGFPGPNFFARPVIGGHFAFLTLERACGGKAIDALKFLDEEDDDAVVDVKQSLEDDEAYGVLNEMQQEL